VQLVKRVCFDIGVSHWRRPGSPFLNTPDDARDYFSEETVVFRAATAYDSLTRKYKDFTDYRKLLDCLDTADELISFNGRIWDLIIIEKLAGEDAMKSVWQKPHHDLAGWHVNWKLENAVKELPPHIASSYESIQSERLRKICNRVNNDLVASHLANTYRDTKFTYALYRMYAKSGETDRTFQDA
jgi:hypothetical protein